VICFWADAASKIAPHEPDAFRQFGVALLQVFDVFSHLKNCTQEIRNWKIETRSGTANVDTALSKPFEGQLLFSEKLHLWQRKATFPARRSLARGSCAPSRSYPNVNRQTPISATDSTTQSHANHSPKRTYKVRSLRKS
jgi:hypothetical protein